MPHVEFRPIPGIPNHAVFLLLLQLALLLLVARGGAEFVKRLGLPAVIGELAAGIVLGPSVFGHYAPRLFRLVFPQEQAQFHLLESVGMLGMVLLLLLTGLETDLRLLKNLGRSALVASVMGMVVPFAMGFWLGVQIYAPAAGHVGQPGKILFAMFLATAMSISAMPVIAKILMDLDLTRRNIGLVILSAGVVDDTAGWLILSVIAGAASVGGAVRFGGVALTLIYLVVFLAAMAFVIYPLLRVLFRAAAEFKTPDADMVFIVVVTFLCAAFTERIGVHAVFGAFIAGTTLRQVPQLRDETVHRLEGFVFAVLAPVFFGIVGLKVNLWSLSGGGGALLGWVLLVACLGKIVGCVLGGIWGGMHFWEAMSIAVAMNARGAMGLVVAMIGLSLGILDAKMFSIIVVVAIATSFMAPLALRLTMRLVRITEEEARRILLEQSKGVFDPVRMRMLLPTAGGPNALEAARVGFQIARRSENPVDILYIDAKSTWWERLVRPIGRSPAGRGLDEHLAALKSLANGSLVPRIRHVASRNVPATIVDEARKDYDIIMVGASHQGGPVGGPVLEEVVEAAPCHIAIVKAAPNTVERYRKLIVPIDGGIASRIAAEFAVRYAEAVGAELTLALLTERRPQAAGYTDEARSGSFDAPDETKSTIEEKLKRISVVFQASTVKPEILRLDYDPSSSAVRAEVATGKYDLAVIGAENRAIQHRMFFGYDTERLIRKSPIAVVIVVPNLARLRERPRRDGTRPS